VIRPSARGPVLMIGASLLFTAMVACVKVARQELGSIELMAWRAVIGVPVAGVLAWRVGAAIRNRRVMALRVGFGFCAMACFFTATKGLTLADLSLISRTQPLLLTVAAPLVLGASEKSGPRVWVLLAAGMVGCAILVGPDLAVGSTWALWALGASASSAAAHLCLRVLGRTEQPAAVVFAFQTAVGAIAFGWLGATGTLRLPPTELWPYVLGAGLFATGGQLLMTEAYRQERAAVVAAASYTGPVWGVLGDVLFFAALPSGWDWVGGALIVAAGLALVWRRVE
jgi:drug/metabolite transporter (DMT)-like permease